MSFGVSFPWLAFWRIWLFYSRLNLKHRLRNAMVACDIRLLFCWKTVLATLTLVVFHHFYVTSDLVQVLDDPNGDRLFDSPLFGLGTDVLGQCWSRFS